MYDNTSAIREKELEEEVWVWVCVCLCTRCVMASLGISPDVPIC